MSGAPEPDLPEIEVTPAMIDAGLHALWPGEVKPWQDEEKVIAKIYRAMETARRTPTLDGESARKAIRK